MRKSSFYKKPLLLVRERDGHYLYEMPCCAFGDLMMIIEGLAARVAFVCADADIPENETSRVLHECIDRGLRSVKNEEDKK